MERPYPGPADPARVREYLLSLNHMHVERFLDETGGSPVGGMTPAAAVSVALAGGDTVRALLGPEFPGEENLRYAISSRRRFLLAVPGKYLDVLLDAPDGLRQAAPFGFGLSRVDSVGIETGAYARIVRLAGAGEEGRAARETLGNWVLLRAARFAEADPAARRRWRLDPPAGRLTWWGGGDTLAVIEVGTPVDGLVAIHVGAGSAARPAEILLVRERELAPLWQALRDEARGAGSAP